MATEPDGPRGLSYPDRTVLPSDPNELWDQIEAKWYEQINFIRAEQDRKLEANYTKELDKLKKQHVTRNDMRLEIFRKIKELETELLKLNQQDDETDNKVHELTQLFEAKRATLHEERLQDDREKKLYFKVNRQNAINIASSGNAKNAATNGNMTATESSVSDAESPVQSLESPEQTIESPAQNAENAEKPIEVVETTTAVEKVEATTAVEKAELHTAIEEKVSNPAVSIDAPVKPTIQEASMDLPVDKTTNVVNEDTVNGMDIDKALEPEKGASAVESKEAADGKQDGIDTPKAQDGQAIQDDTTGLNGATGQDEAPAQNETEDAAFAHTGTEAQDDSIPPNGVEVENKTQDIRHTTEAASIEGTDNAMDVEGGGGIVEDTESSELTSAVSTPIAEPLGFQLQPEEQSKTASPVQEYLDAVEVYDGSGELVDKVRELKLDNQWVNYVKHLPIKRKVEIRPGRKFTAENLASIYEPSDAKGAKWLSCYIQATGEIQGQPCHTCTKPVGVFNKCVILDSNLFTRCGNCEWNRQGCHGASLLPKSRGATGSAAAESPAKPKQPLQVRTGGFTPVNNSATGQKARSPAAEENADTGDGQVPSNTKKPGRKSLPTGSTQKKPKVDTSSATTPMTGSPVPESPDSDELPEITKDVIEFKDDGVFFTHPKFMEGVPLAKISPDHPYWEPDWAPLEPQISAGLKKWQEKLEYHITSGSNQSSKFLANRQVNRGNTVLEYLRDGELHPYQIVGKQYINRQLSSYDTVFRMVQVLTELRKFSIDITPSQWLRHRLYEKWQEQGEDFNLGKTVHDLYHDSKVLALRRKNGFGNIGRPSGFRMEKQGGESAKKTPRTVIKRKEPHVTPKATPQQRKSSVAESTTAADLAAPVTPQETEAPSLPASSARPRSSHRKARGTSAEQQLQHHIQREEAKAAQQGSPREHKKQRLQVETPAAESEDLEYQGYTSSDSYSSDNVMDVDWRVYQVKTPKISTNTLVTQYWHWVDKAEGGSEENMFEHQVLKDVLPNKVTWGVYKEPYDFHLRLAELTEATYAKDSTKVMIGTKEVKGVVWRGDVLVHFKRERTKRRFLSFLKRKGVKLVKASKEYVDTTWDDMDSEVLPHYDSD